jgi:hypothetical protein
MVEEIGTKPYDSMQDISILSTQRKRSLASWGLPDTLLKVYIYICAYCWVCTELIYVIIPF